MNLFFQILSLQLLIFCMYCLNMLLHLISSFLLTRFLLIPFAYVSIELIDCILLSSFEFKEILSISSVKALYLSLLNLCLVFNINILCFLNSLWSILKLYKSLSSFVDGLFYYQVKLLLTVVIIFKIKFFLWHTFLYFLLFIFTTVIY